jgi:hypothetical protein
MINKQFVAIILVVGLLLSIGCATSQQRMSSLAQLKPDVVHQAGKISKQVLVPLNPQLIAPYINVNLIKVAPAAPGNIEPISVNVNITSPVTQQDICGLNGSNFKIEGPALITNVYPISSVAVNQPMTCDYWLSIASTSPWMAGTNALELDYIQGEKQIANATLMFRI